MKKTILFTTIAIGLIGLLGFSYVPKEKQAKQEVPITTIINKKGKKVTTSDESPLDSNATYYIVAKNYAQNGEGVFYQNSISLGNSAIVTSDYARANGIFDFIVNGNPVRTSLVFDTDLDSGVYKLYSIYFYNYLTNSDATSLYSTDNGSFDRSLCAFLCNNIISVHGPFFWYLNEFFDIYLLDGGTFAFNSQINYYAPYGQDIDSYFVNDNEMTSSSSTTTKTILENQPFYSGGLVFDTIRLRYHSAMGLSYYDNSGDRLTWNAGNTGSYSYIEYINTATNRIIVVNQRLTQTWNSGSSSGVVQTKGSRWLSTEYQNIQFFNTPSQTIITTLSTLNNSSYQANTYINTNADVGLGGAFTLLSQAFSSWLPILGVSIVPGITLGMLIFLPLIAGIIILIIWIVKR